MDGELPQIGWISHQNAARVAVLGRGMVAACMPADYLMESESLDNLC
jgi:hypothetical protein